ncbi:aldose epimerase [Nodularia sphaerocarpa]|uniref:aldose epimerase family protein n=1 Tax=Nodularia sphaerocarpa TaxID=137816 RepID=UPI001EFAE8D0|nr:aldose epimerase [Nodularia sphaerocarpa]MDB9373621.1 aldose epimerase [Nodularia sphaerocarpa CS-585]MDB9380016.1 aldose epimerase [Nodularia sphaerocarpa CS-585A2]ULP74410.1 Protein LacX, plasmid [Nodularia sphaerocarpa UHCC 0038]
MFTITLQEQQYKTYILSDDSAGSQIEVVPERGGIITRWRIQGQEIFYLDTERFTHPDLSVRGGNPILFPICGNLPDNFYTHNGQRYTLKQHGFARELPWEVIEQKTEDKASLTLVLNSNEQTKAVYPFDFQVIFTYELQGDTLAIRQEYKNLSSTPMPFSAGFHPYFLTAGDKNRLEFQIPSGQYQDQSTKEIHSFDGNFDFNRDEIDVAFKDLTSQSATVIDPSRSLKLSLDYDNIYSHLVFWTVKGKDFYCLEPWTAPRNALNTGENLTVLAPKASCTAFVRLTANLL